MNKRKIIISLVSALALPVAAQIFNFSLRSNNEQLIDEALSGTFVKINQSYELCDTVNDEHFGRGGKDYFSIIPFWGIRSEKGLIFPSNAMRPWETDKDFKEYEGKYTPLLSASKLILLNTPDSVEMQPSNVMSAEILSSKVSLSKDIFKESQGLPVDTLAGIKKGWIVWLSSPKDGNKTDSLRLTAVRKNIEVPEDGSSIEIATPEIKEPLQGGIYVIPAQSTLGQITFYLSGIILPDKDGWILDFPFINQIRSEQTLTPIKDLPKTEKFNPLKKKKK